MLKLGDIIINRYGQQYKIIAYKNKLYADNGGNMFPLDSKNWDLNKFKKVEGVSK